MADFEPPKPTSGDHVHTAIRIGLSAIPVAGGPAVELFNVVCPTPHVRRLESWRKTIASAITPAEPLQNSDKIVEPIPSDEEVVQVEVGRLWTNFAHESESIEEISFVGTLVAELTIDQNWDSRWYELYEVKGQRYFVLENHRHGSDWCVATLIGDWPPEDSYASDRPMSLPTLQERYPELATKAGLVPKRQLRF